MIHTHFNLAAELRFQIHGEPNRVSIIALHYYDIKEFINSMLRAIILGTTEYV